MRMFCAISLLVSGWLAAAFVQAEEFPYKAYVNADNVYVRSGPGKDYYPTDKLLRGAEVEVYRHDPGGWFAVRPPTDSFSWVSGQVLSIVGDNLAEVTEDKVVAYVGSKFSDVHDVRQVMLEKSELVEIVGEKRFVSPQAGNAETWFKVSPPRGEFRWVYGRYIVPQGIAGTKAEHADPAPRVRRPNRWSEPQIIAQFSGVSDADIVDGGATRISSFDDERVQIPDTLNHDDDAAEIRLAAAYSPAEINHSHGGAAGGRSRPRRMTELDHVNMDLSLIVADPPATWDFHSVRMRAQAALDGAPSALARGRANELLREIDRYERLKNDYAEIDTIRAETFRQNRMIDVATTAAAAPPLGGAGQVSTTPQYDSVGRLRTVVSIRVGAPRFALTNDAGQVLMFVSPAPGVNLLPHVGKVVGLKGERGYMPQLKQSHLTVARVEAIDPAVMVAQQPKP